MLDQCQGSDLRLGLSVSRKVGLSRTPVGVEDAEHHLRIRRAEATSPERVDHVSIPLLRKEQTHEPRQSCGKALGAVTVHYRLGSV